MQREWGCLKVKGQGTDKHDTQHQLHLGYQRRLPRLPHQQDSSTT